MKYKMMSSNKSQLISFSKFAKAPALSSFRSSVDKLSYIQLVRVNAMVNAEGAAEKIEAKRIVRSITPPERKILAVAKSRHPYRAQYMKRYLRKSLLEKNTLETLNIDTDAILAKFQAY